MADRHTGTAEAVCTQRGGDPSNASVPRLAFDGLPDRLKAQLRPKVQRLGYLGEFFSVAGHQPDMLSAFIDLTEAARTALDDELIELVALASSTATGSAYERHQHEQLAARLGLDLEWIRAAERAPTLLPPPQQAVQRYVVAALSESAANTASAFTSVVDHLGVQRAIAVMLLTGRYAAHAIAVHSCALVPPVPSIFDDPGGRSG